MYKSKLFFMVFIIVILFVSNESRRHRNRNIQGSDTPTKCRNDKACINSGLPNHYCRHRGPKITKSECVPKRGISIK